jgi:hypothetical protein
VTRMYSLHGRMAYCRRTKHPAPCFPPSRFRSGGRPTTAYVLCTVQRYSTAFFRATGPATVFGDCAHSRSSPETVALTERTVSAKPRLVVAML